MAMSPNWSPFCDKVEDRNVPHKASREYQGPEVYDLPTIVPNKFLALLA